MKMNFLALGLAALIPLVIGAIWYNPKVFGNTWMRAAKLRQEEMKGANMALIFGLTLFFSFMIAFILSGIVIHQTSIYGVLFNQMKSNPAETQAYVDNFMAKYGNEFRTFKHGALHGTITGLFLALPMIAINAMFERKGAKYIAINAGYFIVSLALMGGVICAMK